MLLWGMRKGKALRHPGRLHTNRWCLSQDLKMGKAEKLDEEQLDTFQDQKQTKKNPEKTWKNVEDGE